MHGSTLRCPLLPGTDADDGLSLSVKSGLPPSPSHTLPTSQNTARHTHTRTPTTEHRISFFLSFRLSFRPHLSPHLLFSPAQAHTHFPNFESHRPYFSTPHLTNQKRAKLDCLLVLPTIAVVAPIIVPIQPVIFLRPQYSIYTSCQLYNLLRLYLFSL